MTSVEAEDGEEDVVEEEEVIEVMEEEVEGEIGEVVDIMDHLEVLQEMIIPTAPEVDTEEDLLDIIKEYK